MDPAGPALLIRARHVVEVFYERVENFMNAVRAAAYQETGQKYVGKL